MILLESGFITGNRTNLITTNSQCDTAKKENKEMVVTFHANMSRLDVYHDIVQ